MLKPSISDALSAQFNKELYSAYLYLSMSAHCDTIGFKGFSNWLYVQAQEETAHAMHIYQHLLERGAKPSLADIKCPSTDYKSLLDIFEQTLKHEQFVTESINSISTLAMSESDHATYQFLQWYVNEQIEEESNADLILQKLKHIGDNTALAFVLDSELATRVFVDPFASTTN